MFYTCPSGHVVLLDDDVTLPGRLSIGSHGYPQLTGVEVGRAVLLHRWLLGLVRGDKRMVDHINRDPMDNRIGNLRIVSPSESSQNVSGRGKSSYRGVHPLPSGRWEARTKFHGRQHYLGVFDSEEEAASAAQTWRLAHMPAATD